MQLICSIVVVSFFLRTEFFLSCCRSRCKFCLTCFKMHIFFLLLIDTSLRKQLENMPCVMQNEEGRQLEQQEYALTCMFEIKK